MSKFVHLLPAMFLEAYNSQAAIDFRRKFLLIVVLIITLGSVINLFLAEYWFNDKDFCLDTGVCTEGLELNTEHGRIKINKENCLKYNYKWNDERKTCNLNEKTGVHQ